MALTNDQITAQNFKDFYGQIRPYLNGQVPTFANQFSRSDLYSTDEKIIGQWIDGKPLYQKIIEYDTPFTATTPAVTRVVAVLDDLNIETVISIGGYIFSGGTSESFFNIPYVFVTETNKTTIDCWYNKTSKELRLRSYRESGTGEYSTAKITIQYTKTTDSAIKVGTGTDYSTEEQIIGTWIDGKPIYQKTVILSAPRHTAWVQQYVVTCNITLAEHNITDLDTLISGVAHCDGGVFNCGVNKGDYYSIILSLLQTLDVIGCTIQYTKTTD